MIKNTLLIYIVFSFFEKNFAQTTLNLNNLNSFKNPPNNWEIVGDVSGKYNENKFVTGVGTGILHNKPHSETVKSEELYTNFEHGDINLSFDFMMPKGSNSGLYLQGQYEVQLFDSWGVKVPKEHDCGAIYQRWNDARGKGKEGYEGHPPRQNVSFAPGLWQHIEINFQAPKFDASGKKIANAKFIKVVQNGFLIHENIECTGPTRGSLLPNDIARGPLRIQGDHGEVAIKNFKYELLDKQPLEIQNLSYKYFEGKFEQIPAQIPSKISSQGSLEKINFRLAEKNSDFLLAFVGKLLVPDADKYTFTLSLTGIAKLIIDGKTIIEMNEHHWRGDDLKQTITLEKGPHALELFYTKTFSWGGRALGLFVKREGTINQPLHEYVSLPDPEPVGLIEVKADATKPVLQRSFVYFDGKKRTHAINIGTPKGVNYAIDLERGAMLSAWKGKFLNTTEMWFERGEPQIAQPLGATIRLDGKNPVFLLEAPNAPIPDSLSVENQWVYKGYHLNSERYPILEYAFQNEIILDHTRALEDGSGIYRAIIFPKLMKNVYLRAGESTNMTDLGNGLFQLDNSFVKIENSSGQIVLNGNIKTLIVPLKEESIAYSIIW
jgi:Domain of Unknown Function (DUF1080)/PA14 domain